MSSQNLYLDPLIRNWVLFPITLVMILVGLLRHYATLLLTSPPKKQPLNVIREQRGLLRAQVLRQSSKQSPLPPSYYHSISSSLVDAFHNGGFLKDGPRDPNAPAPPPANPLTDPAAMDGMMENVKKQMAMNIPQMIIMSWINFFFSGFLVIKLPFPLTDGFKKMLQQGIQTPNLDVRWVSSLSWYFLNLFGLNGLFHLILGNDNGANSANDLASSPFGNLATQASAPLGPGQDMHKIFLQEKDSLELAETTYKWVGDGIEDRILAKWGKIQVPSSLNASGKEKVL